jgi:hypothetical protein
MSVSDVKVKINHPESCMESLTLHFQELLTNLESEEYPGNLPAMNPIKLNFHRSLCIPKSVSRNWQDDEAV